MRTTSLLLLLLAVLLFIGNIRAEDEDEDEYEKDDDDNDDDDDDEDDSDEAGSHRFTTTIKTTTGFSQTVSTDVTTSLPEPPITIAATHSRVECGLRFDSVNRLIVGGTDVADPFHWPWMVALLDKRDNSEHFCGGVLLNEQHVLTAAHCFENYYVTVDPQFVEVRLGEYNLKRHDGYEENFRISNLQLHPEFYFHFNDEYYRNDLAILTLNKPVKFNEAIRPVCLPSNDTQDINGLNATAIGWGDTVGDVYNTTWAHVLQEVEVPIVDQVECNNRYSDRTNFPVIPEKEICAAPLDGGRDTCQRDSGGPLLIQFQENEPWTVIGIVSWGPIHCAEKYPGVYTRVDRFLDWIWEQLR